MNDLTSRVSTCTPAATTRPRGDVAPVIIILVVLLSTLYLASLGMAAATLDSVLTTTAAGAGYLVRQTRRDPAR